jgi:DNA-binding response OmpR family regulator
MALNFTLMSLKTGDKMMNDAITVLLADDERAFTVSYGDALIDEGYNVIIVDDVKGVEENAFKANVLIVDARLPSQKLEGLVVVAKLIENGTLPPIVPIIFISIHDENEEPCQKIIEGLPQLRNRYIWLRKPFEIELLVIKIKEQIKIRNASKA